MNPGTIYGHIKTLSRTIGQRPTGSLANRQAMEYIGRHLDCLGYPVMYQFFDCMSYETEPATCIAGSMTCTPVVSPHSPSCAVQAQAVPVGTTHELSEASLSGAIAVLYGDLAKEPLMPRNFPFYQHPESIEILRLLDEKDPLAVIFISPGPDAVPVLVDGDFLIPSATIAADEGLFLLEHPRTSVTLHIRSNSASTRGANIICQIPGSGKKVVICAHFDTKFYTPGALDNASGIASLLLLADRLRRGPPRNTLEFVFFNGEEAYNIPGEMTYFASGTTNRENTLLAVNIDGIGLSGYSSGISYYSCPDEVISASSAVLSRYPGISVVDPWPQGDHMIFALKEIPAIACSTCADPGSLHSILHTWADIQDNLDIGKILHTTDALEAVIRSICQGHISLL